MMYLPITITKNNTNTFSKEKKLNVSFCVGLWTFELFFIYQLHFFFFFLQDIMDIMQLLLQIFLKREWFQELWEINQSKLWRKQVIKFSRPFWTVIFVTMVWLQVSHMSKVFCWQITASKFCSEFYCDSIGSVIWIRKIVYARIKKSIIRLESLAQQKLCCSVYKKRKTKLRF